MNENEKNLGFVPGHIYKIRTLQGRQTIPREHVLTYLGMGGVSGKELQFSARPWAGTQPIDPKTIIFSKDLGEGHARGDSRPRMNVKVREKFGR